MLFILSWISLYPQTNIFNVEKVTSDKGLSSNGIDKIFQDNNGYLWFATLNGLTRYDGYEYRIYLYDPDNENTLSSNMVNVIQQGNDPNVLWVGTNFGVDRLEIESGRVTRIKNVGAVIEIYPDSKGNIWLGCVGSVVCLNPVNNKFVRYILGVKSGHEINVFAITEQPWNTGIIWIRAKEGLIKYDPAAKKFTDYSIDPLNKSGAGVNLRTLERYADSLLVFGTAKGIAVFNIITAKAEFYICPLKIKSSNVMAINLPLRNKNLLWVTTESDFYQFDMIKRVFINAETEEVKKRITQPLNARTVYEDVFGNLWIGTGWQGVYKLTMSGIDFNGLKKPLEKLGVPVNSSVWALYKSSAGTLWIGYNNSLCGVNFKERTKSIYNYNPANPKSILKRPVRAIIEDLKSAGKYLWLGFQQGGISRFNVETGTFQNISLVRGVKNHCESDNVYTLMQDEKGKLWIGTNGGGLDSYDTDTQKFEHHDYLPGAGQQWVTSLTQAKNGILWLGTFSEGLMSYERSSGIFKQHALLSKTGKDIHSILSVCFDKKGCLWIGTYENGLYKYNVETGKFKGYSLNEGLPNNLVYAILEDNLGFIWVSTDKGISKFNPINETFVNYSPKDGLQGVEYNLGASFKSKEGELFFGGNQGFNVFSPSQVTNPVPPIVLITRFEKNWKTVSFDKPTNQINEIELAYDENSFAFTFNALHFKDPKKNQYRYRLKGYNPGWVYTVDKRKAEYFNITPGTYEFIVEAANSDGLWNTEGRSIKIYLAEAYWQALWFKILVLIFIGVLVYAVTRFNIYSKLNLEKARLDERNKIRNKIARDFHDELGHTATQISLLAGILKKESKSNSQKFDNYLDKISESAKLLFDEMRAFNWDLDPEKDSLYYVVVSLKNFSDSLFDNTEIAFELKGDLKGYEKIILPLEIRQHVLRIFKEGMHNILKHAANCKKVILEISIIENILKIELSDNGCGFEPTENFMGNGLKNIKKRAAEAKGILTIETKPGCGTKISFKIKLS